MYLDILSFFSRKKNLMESAHLFGIFAFTYFIFHASGHMHAWRTYIYYYMCVYINPTFFTQEKERILGREESVLCMHIIFFPASGENRGKIFR